MNTRSRFESDLEYQRRLEEDNRRLESSLLQAIRDRRERALQTGYDDDEPDPEMGSTLRSH